MPKDKLEEFIIKNRASFDDNELSVHVWERINLELNSRNSESDHTPVIPLHQKYKFLINAAAAILISLGSIFIYEYFDEDNTATVAANEQSNNEERTITSEAIIPELKEAEAFYDAKIHTQLVQLRKYARSYPGLEEELTADLNDLDQEFAELKEELSTGVANEEIIEAMIENYQIRLQILEEVLESIQPEEESPSFNIKDTNYQPVTSNNPVEA